MSKYFVREKCRLVDRNVYLSPNTVWDPEDKNYELTSRSLAAALRALWVTRITDEEAEKLIEKQFAVEERSISQIIRSTDVEVKKAVVVEEQKVVGAALKAKIAADVRRKDVITEAKATAVVDNFEPADAADETISQTAIIAARDKRRESISVKKVAIETANDIKAEIKNKVKKQMSLKIK